MSKLGNYLIESCNKYAQNVNLISDFQKSIEKAAIVNPYFERKNITYNLNSWGKTLNIKTLNSFVNRYDIIEKKNNVGIIMAGNIPLVGFHDFMCTFLCGKKSIIKHSNKDKSLFELIFNIMELMNPDFKNYIEICENKLTNFDMVIATGNNFSANQFKKYFNNVPNIIRKSRHSVAVIDGNESKNNLEELSNDIFMYYGLGCRNVSKIYMPNGYNLDLLFNSFFNWKNVINNNAYYNNYIYNKTIYLMKGEKIFDNGFSILKESKNIGSPIGTIFYEYYNDKLKISNQLIKENEKIQCIVSNKIVKNSIKIGTTQTPSIDDFADKVDTMNFLLKLT